MMVKVTCLISELQDLQSDVVLPVHALLQQLSGGVNQVQHLRGGDILLELNHKFTLLTTRAGHRSSGVTVPILMKL